MNLRKRMLLLPLLAVAIVYVTILAYMYLFQNRFIFYPTHDFAVLPDQVGLACEDVWIDVTSTERINGWYIAGQQDKRIVLFLHGNGGNISHRLPHLQFFQSIEVPVLIIDYAGYGRSSGKPSESVLYADANAAYRWLIEKTKCRPEQIVLFGESIGGAVAVDLSTKVPCGGVILESTFTSLRDMAHAAFAFLPTSLLLRSDFNSVEKLGRISCPVLITHSPQDDIVPCVMGQRLYAAAKPPKGFFSLYGGHNDREYINQPEYRRAIEAFLNDPSGVH